MGFRPGPVDWWTRSLLVLVGAASAVLGLGKALMEAGHAVVGIVVGWSIGLRGEVGWAVGLAMAGVGGGAGAGIGVKARGGVGEGRVGLWGKVG